MSAVTSAGPWPTLDLGSGMTNPAVYNRQTPRIAYTPGALAAALTTGAVTSAGAVTTMPVTPSVTKFPLTP